MEFESYPLVSNSTASLNTGSYLNRTEYSLFVNGYTSDLWFGFSANDTIELGVWDRENNFIGWNVLNQSKSYNEVTLSYLNALDFPVTYSYSELLTDFILYKNAKVLVNPSDQLQTVTGQKEGSFFFAYNFTREMAGNINEPLVIKEISPSRKELKLVPLSTVGSSYDAFCKKKVLLKDVSPLYLEATKACPYGQIYATISQTHQAQINTIKSLFFLTTDGAMVNFLKNLYEDFVVFTTVPKISADGVSSSNDRLIRIQGIQTYFTNYLLSNSDTILDFVDVDAHYNGFVSASIERKFSPIGEHPSQQYVEAKSFIYDFFTKFFYQPVSDTLAKTYNEKYYSYLKNGLNLGNNRVLPILDTGMMDERTHSDEPLTLLVKLQSELPNDVMAQTHCWVSNISLAPYVVNTIIKNPSSRVVHKIGTPNFSLPIPNVSLTNNNMSYTAADLQNDSETDRDLTVSKNLAELNVDYTDFQNFVVFSSAELRLKIFKNKVINLSSLSASVQTLDNKNVAFLSASGSTYPFYTNERTAVQSQIDEIVTSFDGYESYLYSSGKYVYSGSFLSSSYVAEMELSGSAYDKGNRDSLINNCPSHILVDSANDDYIVFLSMIGHFFDGIYTYISNMPSEKAVGQSSTEEFTRRVVDYMLETFGWTVDDSLEQANLVNNYLSSEQIDGLNSMSSEDRLKTIRNRILFNLPQIFKTKGTEESVRLLLACYGIPSVLLNVREYGGVNYTDDSAAYTTYERAYLYQWDTSSVHDTFRIPAPSDAKTFLAKISINGSDAYTYNNEQVLFGRVSGSAISSSASGSGEWAVGFVRIPQENSAQMFFRIGYKDAETFKMYSQPFPLFDGNIYNVMLRRNTPSSEYETNANVDAVPCRYDLYVRRNEFGSTIVNLTSSKVCYEAAINQFFDVSNTGSNIMVGGWFAYHNGQGFNGAMDKLQMWYDPITDSNFEDYVNHINSYSFSGSRSPEQSLMFRMHTDYPFNLQTASVWRNANTFYAISSSAKLDNVLGLLNPPSVDSMFSTNAWHGAQTLVYDSASCEYVSQSVYPFQFKVIDYPSTLATSKYGPNKFRNEKVRHISQSVATRFDDKARSTYIPRNNTSPDSNQVGFFVDPQDFKNKDIVRFFGNYDFMDAIGNPQNQFSGSYDVLRNFRNTYSKAKNEYSGSKTLFNELITLYKLYFNRSIFEAIKNLVPARSNVLVGVVIEPTVLERPKYHAKPVYSEVNTGSVFYADITASRYFRDPNTKLVRMSQSLQYGDFNLDTSAMTGFDTSSLPNNLTVDVDVSYINLPNITYPFNYLPQGTYCADVPDKYQLGHYGSSELISAPETIPIAPVVAFFTANPLAGLNPLAVTFTNLSTGATSYQWDFGDGTSSLGVSPIHTYSQTGSYTIRLAATGSTSGSTYTRTNYVNVTSSFIACTSLSRSYAVSTTSSLTDYVTLGTDTGVVKLIWNSRSYPDRFVVKWDGSTVIDTGLVLNTGSVYFNKSSASPTTASVTVTTDRALASAGSFSIECPTDTISCVAFSSSLPTGNPATAYTSSVVLGTDVGIVQLKYAVGIRTNRFVLSWNGSDVIDTGFVSGTGTYIFNKSLAFPVTAQISVYASILSPEHRSLSIGCPS